MTLSLDTIISRNETSFLSNPVGDEIIILNMETGNYLGLNNVGSAIWEHIRTPQTIKELIGKLMIEFDVDDQTCTEQTIEYLEKISELGLLQAAV
jgi:hypothetical protein